MRIVQVLTTLSYGDAVGNDTLALKEILNKNGFETAIYAENIDARLPEGIVLPIEQLTDLTEKDVVIYHLSTGTRLNFWIQEQICKKIMIYHNITPSGFLKDYNAASAELCQNGLKEAGMLKDTFDYILADSEFNKRNLIEMGYQTPIDVLPILIPFKDYEKRPNETVIKNYQDNVTNIVFVGRIAPNKKQEDIIASYYYYQKYYNPNSRLILVGAYNGMETYYERLKDYAEELGVENLVFTGHIKFDEILAYYKLADVFLCMSEHEGFCVPLVEAMIFDAPVIAYDCCAIKDTLGGSGMLLDTKKHIEVAGAINQVVTSEDLRNKMLQNQRERLKAFDNNVVEQQFLKYLGDFLELC